MEDQDLISLISPAPKEEGKPMETVPVPAATASPASKPLEGKAPAPTTPVAESPILPLLSPSPKPQPAATAVAPLKTPQAQQTATMAAIATPVTIATAAEASPILPLLSPSPAPAKQRPKAQAAPIQLQTPASAAEAASPILPVFTPSLAPAKATTAAVVEASPILPLLSPSPLPAKPQPQQQAVAAASGKPASSSSSLTPLALSSPVSAAPTTPSSSASSSSASSSSGSPQSSPAAASPRSAGSNASSSSSSSASSSGPRSKSPLPPRPASASSSPRQRQSTAAEAEASDAASYLSPTASSAARSVVAAAPAATATGSPNSGRSPRAGSPKPAPGGLQEIKEEETEEDGEVVDVDVEAVAAAIAARLMPRGAARSIGSAAEAAGGASKKPPTIITAPMAAAAQQRTAASPGAMSPVHERLHETRLEKDMMDPSLAFMTREHTFRPKRVTEGTEEMFEHAAPPDQEYRRARSIFDRLYDERADRDDYYRQAEELRLQKEVVGCSFAPRLAATEGFNREHVQTEAGPGRVFERLYNGLYDKQDYYRHYEEVKAQREAQECTFLPAILDAPTVDEEARAALPVWERLRLAGAERESRQEQRRLAAEEQERARSPFTPAILEKAPLPTEGEAAALAALMTPHERLYKEGQMRMERKQERLRQKPHGCTFQPQRVAQDTLEGQRKVGAERTEEMYRRGKERVMRDLMREMAKRPPRPRSDEEECTFFPQTNHLKKKT